MNLLLENKVAFVVKGAVLPSNRKEIDEFEAWAATLPGMDRPPSYSMFFDSRCRRDSEEKNLMIRNLRLSPEEGLEILTRRQEEYLKEKGFTNLDPVSDDKKNAQKLVLGRIDLWVHKKPGLRSVCELAGVDYDEVEEVYNLREIELMIAFSKKTSDSIVQKWRDAFNEMVADGTIMKIRMEWNKKLSDPPFPELEDKP